MKYRDSVSLHRDDFPAAQWADVVSEVEDLITGYGVVVTHNTLNDGDLFLYELDADDLWDLHEKAADLGSTLNPYTRGLFHADKERVIA